MPHPGPSSPTCRHFAKNGVEKRAITLIIIGRFYSKSNYFMIIYLCQWFIYLLVLLSPRDSHDWYLMSPRIKSRVLYIFSSSFPLYFVSLRTHMHKFCESQRQGCEYMKWDSQVKKSLLCIKYEPNTPIFLKKLLKGNIFWRWKRAITPIIMGGFYPKSNLISILWLYTCVLNMNPIH